MTSPSTQKLEEKIHALACAMVEIPNTKSVDVTVWLGVNDDVPANFTEFDSGPANDYLTYRRVVEAKDGIATRTITLIIPD